MWNGLSRPGPRACWRQRMWRRGRNFYSVIHEPRVENVQVTCGSSGYVTLNIYTPSSHTPSTPLILYISCPFPPPPAPTPDAATHKPSFTPPKALLDTNTIVQINPRWSPSNPFPFPIHDTLFAYSWILTHLASPSPPSSNFDARPPPRPIAVYGTGLGGTLATSLALTESRPTSGPDPTIAALAVRDAVFDWSPIASWKPSAGEGMKGVVMGPDELRLVEARERLFRKPAAAWDAFASPLLFFRTSGIAIPQEWQQDDQTTDTSSTNLPTPPAQEDTHPAATAAPSPAPTRRAHLVFPPRQSGLRIPATRIAVSPVRADAAPGAKGLRESQAREMVRLMRRSVRLHEGQARRVGLGLYGNGNEAWWDSEAEAEGRVELVEVDDVKEEEEGGLWAREFFDDVLGRG